MTRVEFNGKRHGATDAEDRLPGRRAGATDVRHQPRHDREGDGQFGFGQVNSQAVVDAPAVSAAGPASEMRA